MMVKGMKNATKEPMRTKLSSASRQLPSLKTFESSCNPKTGIGMDIPGRGRKTRHVIKILIMLAGQRINTN